MAIDMVTSADPRFTDLNIGRASGLFPTPEESAAAIALCQDTNDVAQVLEQTLKAGKRPTVLSGGHCYEDFVFNNPHGTIIDVSPMNGVTQDPDHQALEDRERRDRRRNKIRSCITPGFTDSCGGLHLCRSGRITLGRRLWLLRPA